MSGRFEPCQPHDTTQQRRTKASHRLNPTRTPHSRKPLVDSAQPAVTRRRVWPAKIMDRRAALRIRTRPAQMPRQSIALQTHASLLPSSWGQRPNAGDLHRLFRKASSRPQRNCTRRDLECLDHWRSKRECLERFKCAVDDSNLVRSECRRKIDAAQRRRESCDGADAAQIGRNYSQSRLSPIDLTMGASRVSSSSTRR